MAVRDEYSEVEKKMIEGTNRTQDSLSGWVKTKRPRICTEESIKRFGAIKDYWNPLWRDDEYAASTRWGGIIAHPLYGLGFGGPHIVMEATPECGFLKQDAFWVGEDKEFFLPIRPNDSFKIWRRSHHVEDATPLDGEGPRRFRFIAHDVDYINQRDELVSTMKVYLQPTYITAPPEKPYFNIPEYAYTKEEIEFINRIADQEEVRGANILYWEDVSIGDEPRMAVKGPIDMREQVNDMGSMAGARPPMREHIKSWPWELVRDPIRGTVHDSEGIHLSDRVAQIRGFPRAILGGAIGNSEMVRLVTNWMGDDGFIRRLRWRRRSSGGIGDTLVGRGKVVNKYVENGEHMVDLKVWIENMRGMLDSVSIFTVRLLSKENPLGWK